MSANLYITGFYAALLALLFIGLSINVIRLRKKYKVGIGIGDGSQPLLAKAIRVHGNFSEYVPITLFLLACYEINGGSNLLLHVFGASIFVSRILHNIGLIKTTGVSKQREFGMISIFLVMIILAGENIRLFLFN